jgi:simple sugar transport system permease protein
MNAGATKARAFDWRRALAMDTQITQLLAITVIVFVVMAALSPEKFLRAYNFESITFTLPELGLLSIAVMLTMLTGGIDLSIVGVANLAGVLAGKWFHWLSPHASSALGPWPVAAAIGLAIAVGLVAGSINGFLITRLKITPILATLGTSQMFAGLALAMTGGPAIVGFPAAWNFIGNGKLLGVAVPFVIFAALACAVGWLLSRTAYGVRLILIGSNAKAAIFAGLDVDSIVFRSYVLSGLLASVAGVILSGRTNAAKSDYGVSYLLEAVLVSVLGGTNPAGGRGSVIGVCLAVLALMLLASGFQILRFSNFFIDFTWGSFLLGVIALNVLRARRV